MQKKILIPLGALLFVLLCYVSISWAVATSPQPKSRPYDPHRIHQVEPKPVKSTWRFETVYSAKTFDYASLALDSKGNPHIAYGGDQLYYAWFDGSSWHYEHTDAGGGVQNSLRILLDTQDQPHFIYAARSGAQPSLVHVFRSQAGWQHETVLAEFCNKALDQVSFDPQDRLTVVFRGSNNCTESRVYSENTWFAQQSPAGWEVSLVSQLGLRTTLVFDPSGQPILIAQNQNVGIFGIATRSGANWNFEKIPVQVGISGRILAEFDGNGQLHLHYVVSGDESIDYDTWKDPSGWHSQVIDRFPFWLSLITIFQDAQGFENLVYEDRQNEVNLIRRGPDGWDKTPVWLYSLIVNEKVVAGYPKLDRQGRLHRIALDSEKRMLFYFVHNGASRNLTVIDGDKGRIDWPRAALAFDRNGQLAASLYSTDQSIHYLWKGTDGWSDEKAGPCSQYYSGNPINLYFDPENQPHLFYIGPSPKNPLSTTLIYSVRGGQGWTVEGLPIPMNNFREWSDPAVSPEGWPVVFHWDFHHGGHDPALMYRTAAGWQNLDLVNIKPWIGDDAHPQLAYPPGQAPASTAAGDITLPSLVYATSDNLSMAFFDAQKNAEEILPILDIGQYASRFTFDFDSQGRPVILVNYLEKDGGKTTSEGGMFFVTRTGEDWQAYQITGINSTWITRPRLDRQGLVHFTYRWNYLTGAEGNWKITPIDLEGLNLPLNHLNLVGEALRPDTGEFCVEIVDATTNSLLVGCLESIE